MRARSFFVAVAVIGVFVACSAAPAKKKTLCTPNKASYCRCQDRNQGEKTCAADGNSFGPCEPCETIDNPEGPLLPGDPGYGDDDDDFTPPDAGDRDGSGPGTAKCGDGVVQSGEDCDDENDSDDDGCDGKCKLAGASPAAACPGLSVDVWGGDHRPTITMATTGGGTRKTSSLCAASGSTAADGSGSPDRAFHVTAHASGTMIVAVTNTTFDPYLYVAADCAPASVIATKCVNAAGPNSDETLQFGATAGKTYTVIVDGAGGDGSFKVTFSIQ